VRRPNDINVAPSIQTGWKNATGVRWWMLSCLLMAVAGTGALRAADGLPTARTNAPLHMGISRNVFVGINENDASASLKVWVGTVLMEHGVFATPEPQMLDGIAAITRALQNKTVDTMMLTTEEYSLVSGPLMSTNILLGAYAGAVTVEYLLLVNRNANVNRLADLRGRNVIFLDRVSASLAPVWFETLLLQSGLGEARPFCGRIIREDKLSKVVLPVFFGQADACVVTRSGYATMIELNPQVGQRMKILATSPAVVPVVFVFRADYTSPIRDQIAAKTKDIILTVAGQQALTLFECERVEVHHVSILDSALELLATHARLVAANHVLTGRTNALLFPLSTGLTAQSSVLSSPKVEGGNP
jgi:phosphonate transport system substrate-binding protein